MTQATQQAWDQEERGAPFMLHFLLWVTYKLGRRGARLFLYPTVAYFLLTSPSARRASRKCLRRLLGRPATLRDVARHFFTFSACTLDRIFLLSKRHRALAIDTHWSPDIPAVLQKSTGCLLMVAHMGSREALRFTPPPPAADDPDIRKAGNALVLSNSNHHGRGALDVAVLLDRQVSRRMTDLFEKLNPELAAQIIDASERGPSLVLKLKEALQAGRMVGIGADRAYANERTITVQLLGGTAHFPEGPWTLAAALGVPVILGFGFYRGGNRYDAYFELFSERIVASRATRAADLQAHAQRYAARLEHYARLGPYNWFNFYDYWDEDREPSKNAGAADS